MKHRIFLLSLSLTVLAACRSAPVPPVASPEPVANAGRYSINQDRAPSAPLDLSQVREVVPVPINRTMAGNRSPYRVNGRTYHVLDTEEGFQQTGLASWYGEKFHGHDTSNGEVFDMYQVSAAHISLPIPSFARVTNLENQRSIIVRVNDRGPFHNERIIDLSYAAAYKLGFSDKGTALVHVESIVAGQNNTILAGNTASSAPLTVASASNGNRYLQAGAFSDLNAAQRLSDRLRGLTGMPVIIRSVSTQNSNQQLHRVRVGPISDSRDIERISDLMQSANLGQPYVVEE
ncbi:MAG: septal ring lytic transglycosylase RlpA family protein [Gammaproteobacteria bacterium]|nr:septal ring lytic transglycosylase RlpA family protein [Gammaproteobacteria bacterium]